MPGYVPSNKTGEEGVKPYTFDKGGLHIVRAAALSDPVGDFEREILGVGHAIVHDKIVVIDPRSDNCVVALAVTTSASRPPMRMMKTC
jgi:hypothetical protein